MYKHAQSRDQDFIT